MPSQRLDIPRSLRRGGRLDDVETSVDSTLQIVDLVCRNLKLPDLGNASVLDMGCGWRMTKALLEHDIPISRYVGIDVFAETIEFLQSNVTDERFSFHGLDAHNEMYNPEGTPLDKFAGLPIPEESFDIIWLFSVFTHLAPSDYAAMLKLLRPYIHPEGKLVFSLFVNEPTSSGLGFIDSVLKKWSEAPDNLQQHKDAFEDNFDNKGAPDFIDFDSNQPLKWALYSREHALELIEGTGWKVESLNEPESCIQHYMICTPD